MKKLLIALVLTISSSAFATTELDEYDSKKLYYVLAKWGTREADKGQEVTRIHVTDVRCLFPNRDRKGAGCELYDELHDIKRRRSDKAAWLLAKLLDKHFGSYCGDGAENDTGYCETGARDIRCWHPWDDKNGPEKRRYFCEISRIITPN